MGLSARARRARIKRDLEQSGFVSVRTLTEQLGVSDMTVRRDLKLLEKEGALTVVHGGASLPIGADYSLRGQSEPDAKASIGRFAAQMVRDGSSVCMDAGTTVAEVARALPEDRRCYVVTHSLPVMETLLPRSAVEVHCLGGLLRAESLATIGPTCIENLAKVSAEVLFLGAAAVNERGVFVDMDLERSTKTALINAAQRVVLVADHTKFTKSSPILLAPLDVIDDIVTDAEPPPHIREKLEALDIDVHIV